MSRSWKTAFLLYQSLGVATSGPPGNEVMELWRESVRTGLNNWPLEEAPFLYTLQWVVGWGWDERAVKWGLGHFPEGQLNSSASAYSGYLSSPVLAHVNVTVL